MVIGMNKIEKKIKTAVNNIISDITTDSKFNEVLSSRSEVELVINSSFLYRDKKHVKTTKSPECIVATFKKTEKSIILQEMKIAKDYNLNTHYKILDGDSNIPTFKLQGALQTELEGLGDVVFVLISRIEGNQPTEIPITAGPIKQLRFDTSAPDNVSLSDDGKCTIGTLLPIDVVLSEIQNALENQDEFQENERHKFSKAYDKLLDQLTTVVSLPAGDVTKSQETLLGQMASALEEQSNDYRKGLDKLSKDRSNATLLNEVLRIAYNFVTDVQPIIFLLMSLCDLKPIVFWCTIDKHWQLHRAFSKLPWSELGKKEKISEYQDIVSSARNRAFHHFLPFDHTVEVNLEKVRIQAERLYLFPLYKQKGRRGIQLKDQAIIDLFSEFSRAKERPVSFEFWKKNLDVINCTCQLVHSTTDALILLNNAKYK